VSDVTARFTGTRVLVRHLLRRDRLRLPVWLVSLVGLSYSSVVAVQGLYDTPQAIATYQRTVGTSAAAVAMSGPPVALDTVGGITVFEVSQVAVIGVALMAVFLTIRHTRADEEEGRTEVLRAGVLGRQADLLATGLVVGSAAVLVGVGIALSFVSVGLSTGPSLLYGAAVASIGIVFMAVSLVAAQVTEHARSASGLALSALGFFYLLRAVGDVAENGLSWLSPIGWAQAVDAFGGNRWWPLLLSLAGTVAFGVLAGWLTTRRDFGAGLVAPRPGPPHAARWMTTTPGLAARLQRGTVLGWTVGMTVLGVMYGSLAGEVGDMIEGNETLEEFFSQSGVSVVDAYFGTVLLISALAATAFTISSVLRLRTEESAMRAEPILATATSRLSWAGGSLAVTGLGSVLVLMGLGLGAGVTTAFVLSDAGQVGSLLVGVLAYLPAVLLLGALALVLFGWFPRQAALSWAVLAICFVIGWMGDLLSLPDWAMDASPYTHVPQVPMETLTWPALLVLTAITLALGAVGLWGVRRRDLRTD